MTSRVGCLLLVLVALGGCSATEPWAPPDEVREQLKAILGGELTEHWPAVGVYNIAGGPGFIEVAGRWYVAGVVSSVYALDQDEDMCEGGGWSMRVDAEVSFLDDHYDTSLEPDEWYQPPGGDEGDDDDSAAGDDDDSAAADDDDDSAAADDDDDSAADDDDDGESDGCECTLPSESGSRVPAALFGLVAIVAVVTRRRPAC